MKTQEQSLLVLLADDDPDDQMLVQDAFAQAKIGAQLRCVNDGEELLAYLRREGEFAGLRDEDEPSLILLDLNMPRKNGQDALREIKADPLLSHIPVIALSTTLDAEDVVQTYKSGVSSFIAKPTTFVELVAIMNQFLRYWFETVVLARDR